MGRCFVSSEGGLQPLLEGLMVPGDLSYLHLCQEGKPTPPSALPSAASLSSPCASSPASINNPITATQRRARLPARLDFSSPGFLNQFDQNAES